MRKDYTFKNPENLQQRKTNMLGVAPKSKRPVLCLTNNTVYPSIIDASKCLGLSTSSIRKIINGVKDKIKGFEFKKDNKTNIQYGSKVHVNCFYCGIDFTTANRYYNSTIKDKRNFYCCVPHSFLGRRKINLEKANPLIGKRFGRLIVLKVLKTGVNDASYAECICDCGNLYTIRLRSLRAKIYTTSCGCLIKEIFSKPIHGDSGTTLYQRYTSIKGRCFNKKDTNYKSYGGRGITMCDEWVNSYVRFKEWALLNGFSPNLQIDRIDNNGIYEPSNCRWVTAKINCNNRRNTILIEFNGTVNTISGWSEYFNIKRGYFAHCIQIKKMSISEILKKLNIEAHV